MVQSRGEARPWLRALRITAYLVVAAFLSWTVRDLALRWRDSPSVDVHVGWLLGALVPLLVVSAVQAWAWLALVRGMVGAEAVRPLPALRAYFLAQLARYTPGKVGMPAMIMSRAGSLGVSAAVLAMSVVVATGVSVVCGVIVGGVAIGFGAAQGEEPLSRWLGPFAVPAVSLSVIGLLLATVIDRKWLPAFLRRFAGARRDGPLLPLRVILLTLVVWLAWLVHGGLLLLAVGASASVSVQASGYFALAPVAGVLSLVAPGGLGVREAVITAGIAPGAGAAPAVVAAILSRLLSVGADVLAWLAIQARQAPAPR